MSDSRSQQFFDYVTSLEKEAATLREEVERLKRLASAVSELVESLNLYEQWTAADRPLTEVVSKEKTVSRRYDETQVDSWITTFQSGVSLMQIAAGQGCSIETVRHRMARRGVYATKKDLAQVQATPEPKELEGELPF